MVRYHFGRDSDLASEGGSKTWNMGTHMLRLSIAIIASAGYGSEAYIKGAKIVTTTSDSDIMSKGDRCN